jgi:hypothetical protein
MLRRCIIAGVKDTKRRYRRGTFFNCNFGTAAAAYNSSSGGIENESQTTSDVVDRHFSKISVVDQMQNDRKVTFDVLDRTKIDLKPYSGAFDRTAFFRGEITTVRFT